MLQRTLLAMLALVLLPLASQAQETYTIKIKKSIDGSTTRDDKVEVNVEEIKVSDTNGNLLDEKKETTTLSSIYVQTTLERPDVKKKATALKRIYEKATVKDKDGTRELSYQGKTVIIEKKDGKYRYKIENGAAITGDAAKWLDKEFNQEKESSDLDMDRLMLPSKAVKAGESWKIPMADFIKDFEKGGWKTIADKSTGTGKLVKAYLKDGKQFGDLEYKLEIGVKSVKESDGEIVFQPGAALVMEIKMSMCIDGSLEDGRVTFQWRLKGTALVPTDNPKARVDLHIQATIEGTTTELLKK
jgi:hypothetical protein